MRYNIGLVKFNGWKPTPVEHKDTLILVAQKDEDGNSVVVEKVLTFPKLLKAKDYSLRSLLDAGIDPGSYHCNTGATSSRVDKETQAQDFLKTLPDVVDTPSTEVKE